MTAIQIMHNIWIGVIILICVWQIDGLKWFIKSMLSEPGGKDISSKRVIAISSTAMFLYLCQYAVRYFDTAKHLDPNIIIALVVLIVLSAAIATASQIYSIGALIKGKLEPVAPAPAADPPQQQININPPPPPQN